MKRRNFKLSTKITLATSSIVIVCLVVLFFTANSNITKIMRQAANDNMITSLESKTQIIEEYVDDAESIMKAEIIQKIAAATDEQAMSVAQVTQGIDQISAVVQTNSATAEESAAASEELSGQAQAMKELVGRFKLPQTDEA